MAELEKYEKTSDILMQIMAGYLVSGCDGCPFYGIEEYEIAQYCDGVPLNCCWISLVRYFKGVEAEESNAE